MWGLNISGFAVFRLKRMHSDEKHSLKGKSSSGGNYQDLSQRGGVSVHVKAFICFY